MKDFFKSKLNIVLFSLQVLALVFLLFGEISVFCLVLFFVLEGAFFVCYGIRYFLLNVKIDKDKKIYELLPLNEEDIKKNSIKLKRKRKSNIFLGVMFIIFGIVLITLIF